MTESRALVDKVKELLRVTHMLATKTSLDPACIQCTFSKFIHTCTSVHMHKAYMVA